MFLVDDEFSLEVLHLLLCQVLLPRHRHAVQIVLQSVEHEHFCVLVPEQLGQVRFDLADQGSEGTMLDEALDELDDTTLHLFLLLHLNVVGEDLEA